MRAPAPVWRRRAIAVALLAVLFGLLYMLWLRDSSLVAVDTVKVEGLTANQDEITAAFDTAGREMTTLHIDEEELRRVAGRFPTIATIDADPGFPSTLTVKVTERLPVGIVRDRGEDVPVSGDGTLLPGLDIEDQKLPRIDAEIVKGGALAEEGASQAEVLGAAPDELRERIKASAYDLDRGGVVVQLDGAPDIWFGGPEEAESKWRAAVTVLADGELGSPTYVDVSVPDRVVTGG